MTDNPTELLREGLTKRGIEWRSGLEGVTFVGDWCFVEYDNGKLAATCEPVLTPEQAIAATLGSERIAELEAENERLRKAGYEIGYHDAMKAAKRGGTLTAEQVREAIKKHAEDDSCYIFEVYGEMCGPIADELNARAERTCVKFPSLTEQTCIVRRKGFEAEFGYWRCSECNCENFEGARYCMGCGAKVVGE